MLLLLIFHSADFRASYSKGNKNLLKTNAGFSEMQKKSRRQTAIVAKFPKFISLVQSCHTSIQQGTDPVPWF